MFSTLKGIFLSAGLMAILLVLSACNQPALPAQSSTPAQQESDATGSSEAVESSDAAEPVEDADSDSTVVLDRINLNDMTREQLLETIPDFGSRMVREFFEYQPYVSIQQFRREIGKYVDDEQVAYYESYVYVPIEVNDSDGETLKQMPGVDDATAESLMAARPFDSSDAFLAALSEHVSEEQLDLAASYLTE